MVKLDIIRAANTAFFQSRPLVAVFAGATAGIGESTLRALASAHGSNGKGLRVYVAGRRKEAAEKILADCSRVCPAGNFIFVRANDLSLLEDVDKVCAEIARLEQEHSGAEKARVDLLYMSQGDFTFTPRKDTKEGLEFRVSLLYYSRMKFILNLMPLLLASEVPAHVVSVFAAGKEAEMFLDDISMRDPKHWGTMTTRTHVSTMHTFFFEHLAAQHPGKLSLVHLFPGLVMTPAFHNPGVPLFMRIIFAIFGPLFRLMSTPVPEAGERTLFLTSPQRFPAGHVVEDGEARSSDPKLVVATGTDGNTGSGAYGVYIDGETCHNGKVIEKYRAEGVGEKLCEHTMKAIETIALGRVWTE